MKKNIILGIVLVLIVGAILYLQGLSGQDIDSDIEADITVEEVSESLEDEGDELSPEEIAANEERISEKSVKYERAKELVEPNGYINADNITVAEYIGKKVILVDFWTYSCINCQRTLPYLTSWYEKYKDEGFLLIGVHTPEFEFEKDYDNLQKAVEKWDISYPVVQDNDKKTWRAYRNRYWPRKYMIDIDGFIVYDHIGEGAYQETEELIQKLLKERAEVLKLDEDIDTGIVSVKSDKGTVSGKTPEIYFGYDFSREQLGNEEGLMPDKIVTYNIPLTREKDLFYLEGSWRNNEDNMELVSKEGSIYLEYFAKSVNIVAGAEVPVKLEIFLDGNKVKDVTVQEFDLYNIVSSDDSGNHVVEIKAEKGVRAFTFTFG